MAPDSSTNNANSTPTVSFTRNGNGNNRASLSLRQYRDDATSVSDDTEDLAFADDALINASEASDEEEYFDDGNRRRGILKYMYIPNGLQKRALRIYEPVARWIRGPVPPRPWKIKPFFPAVQYFPVEILRRWLPKQRHRFWALMAFYAAWVACFTTVLHKSAFATDVPGWGNPVRIRCEYRFW
jgi:hypothetical protein